jgi:hypothetical protein
MKQNYELILKQIKRAEADIFLWQILVDKVTGNFNFMKASTHYFQCRILFCSISGKKNLFAEINTLAVIFCEYLEFKMQKKEVNNKETKINIYNVKCNINSNINFFF